MQSFKESAPHEIYLRAFTEAKPLAPLKLYANVSRKFLVGRELDDKVKDKIRDRTLEAAKQRTERKAIFLEAPPTAASGSSKKRKTQPATTASKKLHERFPSASSAPSPSPSPSPTRSPSKDADPTGPRVRMIRCLVSQPRFEEEVVRLVGGPNCAIARKEELSQLLREVTPPLIAQSRLVYAHM